LKASDKSEKPVFYDPRGRRWRRVRRTYLTVAVLVTAVTAVFIASVFVKPLLPIINLRPPITSKSNKPESKPPELSLNPRDREAKKAQDKLNKAQPRRASSLHAPACRLLRLR
jgi:hypothetical protein